VGASALIDLNEFIKLSRLNVVGILAAKSALKLENWL
jgi:hypothetical protein